jgi:UTP--glucose-1-phosphate uridylyltransferase
MKPVRKAVLPVAGFGTRVLPATKAVPKEMLTVFDRPALQYVVDEAREAGIEHFGFVTGRGKQAIEDYFYKAFELEARSEAKKKDAILAEVARRPAPGRRQLHAPAGRPRPWSRRPLRPRHHRR